MTTNELLEYIITRRKKGADKIIVSEILRDIAINTIASMFSYKNLPDSCLPEFAEQFLIMDGFTALWKYDGDDAEFKDKYIFSPGSYAERPNVYGIGHKFIANTLNGYVKTLTPGVDCVICKNNSLYMPDMPLIMSAVNLLTEGFTSLKTNIIYSRLKPVFKVNDDKTKAAVEEAFKSIKEDLEPIQITSKNVLSEIEGTKDVDILDITDVKNADKLQYIVKAIDDIMRWIYTLYGQAIQGNAKLAQQSVDEVQGSTSTSFIIPNDRLKMRKEFCQQANDLFGLDIDVDFSAAWKVESIKYKKEADINENGEIEELGKAEEEVQEVQEVPADPEESESESE